MDSVIHHFTMSWGVTCGAKRGGDISLDANRATCEECISEIERVRSIIYAKPNYDGKITGFRVSY